MVNNQPHGNYVPKFESVDQIQNWILSLILNHGGEAFPRGLRTLEIYPVVFTLLNPRRRCLTNEQRRWSLPLALGEFCWHISGSNELQFMQYYSKNWSKFSDDGFTIRGSCYGYKIFNSNEKERSQWEKLVQLLRTDPQSRRAVLSFFDEEIEFSTSAKDIACTCTLQFLIRNQQLHAFVHMRSNDAIWGLPYDIFLFTMLQELLANLLELELGTYSHFAASLHLYERHFGLAQQIIESNVNVFFEMPEMEDHQEIKKFLELESEVRLKGKSMTQDIELCSYWKDLLEVLNWYSLSRRSRDHFRPITIPTSSPYSVLLRNLTP